MICIVTFGKYQNLGIFSLDRTKWSKLLKVFVDRNFECKLYTFTRPHLEQFRKMQAPWCIDCFPVDRRLRYRHVLKGFGWWKFRAKIIYIF
jgi:hypothetical protein